MLKILLLYRPTTVKSSQLMSCVFNINSIVEVALGMVLVSLLAAVTLV